MTRSCLAILLSFALTCAASAESPSSQPTSPAAPMKIQRPVGELLRDLGDVDPSRCELARAELMLLEFREIDKLKSAAAEAKLSDKQVADLREIVLQIFVKYQLPSEGAGWGFLGIKMPEPARPNQRESMPAVVLGRVMGCDAYRVLREGDTIVGMQGITRADESMTAIANYSEMRAFLQNTKPGDWILIRVYRNGEPAELPLRLGLNRGDRNVDADVYRPMAEQYWSQQFAPIFKGESGVKSSAAEPAS